MITRFADAGDFADVLPMIRQHRALLEQADPALYKLHPDAERRFHRWIGQIAEDPRAMLLIVEDAGRIIGFLSAVIEQEPPIYVCDEHALVREWWVDPDFRGRGAGRALLKHAASQLAKCGVHQIRIRTAANDSTTRAMLKHCGYHPGGCDMVMNIKSRP
jgi:GNAT superfamily N-acetyltransferase